MIYTLVNYKWNSLIVCFLLLQIFPSYAQTSNNSKWTAFWNEETELLGFKNEKGEVVIEAEFMGLTVAQSFEDIIAVMEENNGEYKSYYLTKSGKKVGQDSLYIWDNAADCESEGFIRFRDKKTDKAGLLDKQGNVVIPAIYNELSRVHNGLVWTLQDAEKKYWDGHKESGCNHYTWIGGKEQLVNTQNEVLVEDFKPGDLILDYYSLSIEQQLSTDPTKFSFKGLNDEYYTFTNHEKAFEHYLNKEFLPTLTLDKLLTFTSDTITYWEESTGWIAESKVDFINRNFVIIQELLATVENKNASFFISIEGLNPYIYEGADYAPYFNNCGEAIIEKYPVFTLIINHKKDTNLVQDYFEFLKTETGYHLIGISIKSRR